MKDILQSYEPVLDKLVVQPEHLLSLKLLIYSVGNAKIQDAKYQAEFVKKLAQFYIDFGKHLALVVLLI